MNTKNLRVIGLTLGCWGLILLSSGIAMTSKETTTIQHTYSLTVSQIKVSESKTNEIKLKDMTLEINNPLSVDVKDYLENVENIDESVLKSLKLDTSEVNVQEAGKYTYTISYKKKKYNGIFTITEKELPKVNLTLRNLTLKKDSVLDTNLSTYIVEKIDEEVQKNIVLDLSQVKTNIEGTYQYTITYNNKLYTANIEIYTPQAPTVITPNTQTQEETKDKEETSQENKQDENNEDETTNNFDE